MQNQTIYSKMDPKCRIIRKFDDKFLCGISRKEVLPLFGLIANLRLPLLCRPVTGQRLRCGAFGGDGGVENEWISYIDEWAKLFLFQMMTHIYGYAICLFEFWKFKFWNFPFFFFYMDHIQRQIEKRRIGLARRAWYY